MSRIAACGRPEVHLPHEWTPEDSWSRYDITICAGEVRDGEVARAAIQLVLAAVMRTHHDTSASYEDDTIASTAVYKIEQMLGELVTNLRSILEPE